MTAKTAFVVPVYNAERYLTALLESLLPQVGAGRVWIVDNASTDRAVEIAETQFPAIRVQRLTQNKGFGAACNVGLQAALNDGADLIFVLNQDITLEFMAVEQAIVAAQANPKVGFLALFQLNYSGTSLDPIFRNYLPATYWDDLLLRAPQTSYVVPFVPAAAILLRRECLLALGAFDTLYFMYLEDRDLCHRLQQNGWQIAIAPLARVRHDCGQVRASKCFRWNLNWYRSRMIYHLKTSPRPLPVAWLTGLKYLLPQWSLREAFHWLIAWFRMIPLLSQAARHRQLVPRLDDTSPSSKGGN